MPYRVLSSGAGPRQLAWRRAAHPPLSTLPVFPVPSAGNHGGDALLGSFEMRVWRAAIDASLREPTRKWVQLMVRRIGDPGHVRRALRRLRRLGVLGVYTKRGRNGGTWITFDVSPFQGVIRNVERAQARMIGAAKAAQARIDAAAAAIRERARELVARLRPVAVAHKPPVKTGPSEFDRFMADAGIDPAIPRGGGP